MRGRECPKEDCGRTEQAKETGRRDTTCARKRTRRTGKTAAGKRARNRKRGKKRGCHVRFEDLTTLSIEPFRPWRLGVPPSIPPTPLAPPPGVPAIHVLWLTPPAPPPPCPPLAAAALPRRSSHFCSPAIGCGESSMCKQRRRDTQSNAATRVSVYRTDHRTRHDELYGKPQ
eukprot:COSAG05_NODE_130_length_17165_cov_154.623638_19_plen_172_part_00